MRSVRRSPSIVAPSIVAPSIVAPYIVLVAALALAVTGCSDDDVKPDSAPHGDLSAVDMASDQMSMADMQQGDGPPSDAGSADQGPQPDGGAPGCSAGFAGCMTHEDRTGASSVSISFGGGAGNTYVPKCITIKVGTVVTFQGSFTSHPLQQACGPASVITNGSGSSTSFTFSVTGRYGYFCPLHGTSGGSGMAGAIEVVP